jgi:hypothetical protein
VSNVQISILRVGIATAMQRTCKPFDDLTLSKMSCLLIRFATQLFRSISELPRRDNLLDSRFEARGSPRNGSRKGCRL